MNTHNQTTPQGKGDTAIGGLAPGKQPDECGELSHNGKGVGFIFGGAS